MLKNNFNCNSKGVFSFIIILAIISIILITTITINNSNQNLEKTKNELIKIEISQKERTLIENNIDKIIETKLREQIILKNYNSLKIQKEINSKLLTYLQNKAQTCDTFSSTKGELSLNYLNNNSTTYAIQNEYTNYGEYSYTSNLTKNTLICKEFGEKTIIEFKIPINYTTKVIN